MMVPLRVGDTVDRDELLHKLIDIHYERNDLDPARGKFRVRGDVIECWPAYEEFAYRIELWGDQIDGAVDDQSAHRRRGPPAAGHLHLPGQALRVAAGPHRAGARRKSRENSTADWRNFAVTANCSKPSDWRPARATTWNSCAKSAFARGSRTTAGPSRAANRASRRITLLDFFPDDFLLFVDESHATMPQVRGMFAGDHSRKTTLVEHGFRLPMALDNRPLKFDEFNGRREQTVFVSATPADWELAAKRRRGRRAGHSTDRPDRPDDPHRAGPRPGAASLGRRFKNEPPSTSGCWSPRSPSGWPRT